MMLSAALAVPLFPAIPSITRAPTSQPFPTNGARTKQLARLRPFGLFILVQGHLTKDALVCER